MGELCNLCDKGDLKINWDKKNPEETKSAEKVFKDLVKDKGYLAFKTTKLGRKSSKRIYEFDPEAEKIVVVPPVKGG